MAQWFRKRWYVVLILLCAAVLAGFWLFKPWGYTLPFAQDEIDSISFYHSASDWSLKKSVTEAEDIARIVKELEAMRSAGSYHTRPMAAGCGRFDMVFHLKDGTCFVCSIADDSGGYYFSDGTKKTRVYGTFLTTLWETLDYPEEVSFTHWDNITLPQV